MKDKYQNCLSWLERFRKSLDPPSENPNPYLTGLSDAPSGLEIQEILTAEILLSRYSSTPLLPHLIFLPHTDYTITLTYEHGVVTNYIVC